MDPTQSERDRALQQSSFVTHGDNGVTVYRSIPCPEACGCNYGSEPLLRMTPEAAEALADELQRCARYSREREARG
jgi:hypothetical protein